MHEPSKRMSTVNNTFLLEKLANERITSERVGRRIFFLKKIINFDLTKLKTGLLTAYCPCSARRLREGKKKGGEWDSRTGRKRKEEQ